LYEKVQDEVERALEAGRARVQQLVERREKEEEHAARPKALMEEIRSLMEPLQADIDALKRATDGAGTQELPPAETAQALADSADAVAVELKAFSAQVVAAANEIKETPLPETVRPAWTKVAHEIVEVKRRGEAAVGAARLFSTKVLAAERKQQLEGKKAELRRLVEDASASVPSVERLVVGAEAIVEPFVKGRRKEEAVLVPLCAQAETAVVEAKTHCESAKQELRIPFVAPEAEAEDEMLKKDIEAFVDAESKLPRMRVGQLERRLQRVVNIVTSYRKELRLARNKLVFSSMKDDLLEKVKGNGESTAAEEAVAPLLEAEAQVEPLGRHKHMTVEDMRQTAEQVQASIDAARAALEAASFAVMPISDSVDDDLKRKLRAVAAPHVKRPLIKLGQLERRLVRVVNLLATFRKAIARKEVSSVSKVQAEAGKAVQAHLASKGVAPEALFERLCGGAPGLDEAKFVAFIAGAAQEEGGEAELSEEDLRRLHASFRSKGEALLSKADFLRIARPRLRVVKPTVLTSDLSLDSGKAVRPLRVGEILEILAGPLREEKAGLMRVRARVTRDGKEGWATVAGNAGTVFLADAGAQ